MSGVDGDVWAYIGGLREDLGRAEERISQLEGHVGELLTRLHDHEQTVPHEEAQ